ncbi:hypothetical protein ACFQ1S_01215 [Kibdelosporangium lantanae]|uniref:Uncharacterized protein n=1 Tax=Kibdelosporangium lantanae TaxID=1497396 RepID=A0ABW3M407_9PSEU
MAFGRVRSHSLTQRCLTQRQAVHPDCYSTAAEILAKFHIVQANVKGSRQ